tara:strand:+ start:611 stop:1459 length:849 start_codon:yes stop_codon:yes gene_type:complete
MSNKNVIITGITSGIGTAIALDLAKRNYKINLVARTEESGNIIKDLIYQKTENNDVHVYKCDLSLQTEIHEFVNNFKKQNNGLDILINNAAIIPNKKTITKEGNEMQFAVNYMAPYLLSRLLLDLLKNNAPSRIVNTSSTAHTGGSLNVNDFQKLNEKYNMRGWGRYLDTKLQLTIDTIALSKALEGTGITCNAVHPGFVNTNLGRQFTPKFMRPVNKLLGIFILSPKGGADPIIKAACSDEYENITGKYFHRFKQKEASKKVFDKNVSSKLMEYTKNITKI